MRILAMAAALALCCATVSAEKIAKPGADPIQAELMADLHARLLKVGQTVFARVTVEWRSPTCHLSNGAVLEAHVVSVVPSIKPVKASEVGLAFTGAQCGGLKMGPFNLLLSAIAAPPDDSNMGNLSQNLPVLGMSGMSGQVILNSMRISNAQISPIYMLPLIPRMEETPPMGMFKRGSTVQVWIEMDDNQRLPVRFDVGFAFGTGTATLTDYTPPK